MSSSQGGAPPGAQELLSHEVQKLQRVPVSVSKFQISHTLRTGRSQRLRIAAASMSSILNALGEGLLCSGDAAGVALG